MRSGVTRVGSSRAASIVAFAASAQIYRPAFGDSRIPFDRTFVHHCRQANQQFDSARGRRENDFARISIPPDPQKVPSGTAARHSAQTSHGASRFTISRVGGGFRKTAQPNFEARRKPIDRTASTESNALSWTVNRTLVERSASGHADKSDTTRFRHISSRNSRSLRTPAESRHQQGNG